MGINQVSRLLGVATELPRAFIVPVWLSIGVLQYTQK